jgi:hypothetical protein
LFPACAAAFTGQECKRKPAAGAVRVIRREKAANLGLGRWGRPQRVAVAAPELAARPARARVVASDADRRLIPQRIEIQTRAPVRVRHEAVQLTPQPRVKQIFVVQFRKLDGYSRPAPELSVVFRVPEG